METLVKNRKLKVEGMTCEKCESKIEENLSHVDGVLKVNANKSAGTVAVEYDLAKVNIKVLESTIRESGFAMPSGFISRFSRGWLAFTEQNEVDNMNYTPACCSKPPK